MIEAVEQTETKRSKRNLWRVYGLEARYEFLKLWRLPAYAVPTLAFPLMFYIIFGLTFGSESAGPISVSTYMLATYGAFGVIGIALFGFGVGVATERAQGWMRLKRTSPMPLAAYFTAKVVMALLFSLIVVLGLFALGFTVGEVRLPLTSWLSLLGVLLIGVLPFCAMGLALGYLVGPNAAPAVVNLIYLPMVFASGLWIPLAQLPHFLQVAAPYLPPYHLSQLALSTLGIQSETWVHIAVLLGFTVLFLLIAAWAYRRDEGQTYG